jgi:nucleoside-diphosphate-sugar epimerase/uncharacterized membrane protein
LTSEESITEAFEKFRRDHGKRIAAVLHLAAYYDFTGEPHPLYKSLNVEGTERLLKALRAFDVEIFVYPSTMLVHAAGKPGLPIDETTPIAPAWDYPRSKAAAEKVIEQYRGTMKRTILRCAGVYSDTGGVPTLTHQIQRIYERSFKSHLYPGDAARGQSMVHIDDVADAFERVIERRSALPGYADMLIGEPEPVTYEALQNVIASRLHGERGTTLEVPRVVARAGAWLEEHLEPIVPDSVDQGEKPFIRPFMIALANDHYELDISRASELLGWRPRHRLMDTLPAICDSLKRDPVGWYRRNKLTPPNWLAQLTSGNGTPVEILRRTHETRYVEEHQRTRWAHFINIALGAWLVLAPITHGYAQTGTAISSVLAGATTMFLASLSLSWRFRAARWALAVVGLYIMAAPLLFWAADAAAYLDGTLIGALVTGLAVAIRPTPGIAPVAVLDRSTIPPDWSFSPSTWTQRLPIIVLAFVGLFISRYLAAYQLEHITSVWEPLFAGSTSAKNGTEEIITSSVSRAWPVPDAGLGALTYALEIITGLIGSARRWRTMPWLVMLFGLMIVPLGAVSIFFIVIQPIVIGTWCTLCLLAAAAMVLQIPYSLDELVATVQFLWRRHRAGRSLLRVFFVGDTDVHTDEGSTGDEFDQPPSRIVAETLRGGVGLPWNLLACAAIGAYLMSTRLTVDTIAPMAHGDHLIGALVITVSVTSFAEVARPLRFINVLLGGALLTTPFLLEGGGTLSATTNWIAGTALILLSVRRGDIRGSYGALSRYLF